MPMFNCLVKIDTEDMLEPSAERARRHTHAIVWGTLRRQAHRSNCEWCSGAVRVLHHCTAPLYCTTVLHHYTSLMQELKYYHQKYILYVFHIRAGSMPQWNMKSNVRGLTFKVGTALYVYTINIIHASLMPKIVIWCNHCTSLKLY